MEDYAKIVGRNLRDLRIRFGLSKRDVLRNELCFKCGNYREAHNGACDGCRWENR